MHFGEGTDHRPRIALRITVSVAALLLLAGTIVVLSDRGSVGPTIESNQPSAATFLPSCEDLEQCLRDTYKDSKKEEAITKKKEKVIEGSISFLKNSRAAIKNPTLGHAAQVVSSIGTVAGALIPPPGGMIVGGISSMIGAIFPADPPPVTNEDLMKSMTEGFQKVGEQFGAIRGQLLTMEQQLQDIAAGVQQLKEGQRIIVAKLDILTQMQYQTLANQYKVQLEEMMGDYQEYKLQLASASLDPNDAQRLEDVKGYLKGLLVRYAGLEHSIFQPEQIRTILQNVCKAKGSSPYVTAIQYHQLVGARYMLFDMKLSNELFRLKLTSPAQLAEVERLVNNFQRQVDAYANDLDTIDAECVKADDFGGFNDQAAVEQLNLGATVERPPLGYPDSHGGQCPALVLPGWKYDRDGLKRGYYDDFTIHIPVQTRSISNIHHHEGCQNHYTSYTNQWEWANQQYNKKWEYQQYNSRPKAGLRCLAARMSDAELVTMDRTMRSSLALVRQNPTEWVNTHSDKTGWWGVEYKYLEDRTLVSAHLNTNGQYVSRDSSTLANLGANTVAGPAQQWDKEGNLVWTDLGLLSPPKHSPDFPSTGVADCGKNHLCTPYWWNQNCNTNADGQIVCIQNQQKCSDEEWTRYCERAEC